MSMQHRDAIQAQQRRDAMATAGRLHREEVAAHATRYQQAPATTGVDGNLLLLADVPQTQFIRLHESRQKDERGSPEMKEQAVHHFCRVESRYRREHMPQYRDYLSPKQAAHLLNLSPSQVRELVRDKKLDARRPGSVDGKICIPVESFLEHLASAGYSEDAITTLKTRIADMTRETSETRI